MTPSYLRQQHAPRPHDVAAEIRTAGLIGSNIRAVEGSHTHLVDIPLEENKHGWVGKM